MIITEKYRKKGFAKEALNLLTDYVFVILDRTQFEFGITNRNKIITPEGTWTRISVPVKNGQKFFQINDVKINNI